MLCRTGNGGMRLFAQRGDVGVCYRTAAKQPPQALAFRASVLEQFEGRTEDLVTLDEIEAGKGRARWTEGAVPRVAEFETVPSEKAPDLPRPPAERATLPSSFLQALDEAAQTTARDSGRFALTHVQLRGQSGEVIASDGKQLLVHSGFTFPWKDNVMVPRVRAFGMRELAPEETVKVGRVEQQVVICAGYWTFLLGIDDKARFPEVRDVIPRPSSITCRLRVGAGDAAFLVNVLPKLPGDDDEHSPVTLELNGKAVLRARGDGKATVTAAELVHSRMEGQPMCLCLDSTFLRRAMPLGCTELGISNPNAPVVARNASRLYLMMPLDEKAAIPPCKDAICITSSSLPESPPETSNCITSSSLPEAPPEPSTPGRTTMPLPNPNGHDTNGSNEDRVNRERGPGIAELISEAEELRNVLQDASNR